jgi:hypothetical protein
MVLVKVSVCHVLTFISLRKGTDALPRFSAVPLQAKASHLSRPGGGMDPDQRHRRTLWENVYRATVCAVVLVGIVRIVVWVDSSPNVREPFLHLADVDQLKGQGGGSDRSSQTHFTLGNLGSLEASECHLSTTNGSGHNRVCVFRHACWSPSRPNVVTALPRGAAPEAWPEPDHTQAPRVGFDISFELRGNARPEGVVLLVGGATAVVGMFQDHMPHFSEMILIVAGLLMLPHEYNSSPVSHLLLEVAGMQPPTHPREWIHMLLDIVAPMWRSMLFTRPTFRGELSGLLRPSTALHRWWDPQSTVANVLLPGDGAGEPVHLSETALTTLSQTTQNYTVCFEHLWVPGGKWMFDSAAGDAVRQRVHTVLGIPSPAPRHICVLNRLSSRRITNGGEVLDFISRHSTLPNVRSFVLDGEDPIKQIRLISTCALVISPHGAQLTNAIFMPRGAVVVEVFSWSMAAVGQWLVSGPDDYFRENSERAGLVHETIVGSNSDLEPNVVGSCSHCWNATWSGYSDAEMEVAAQPTNPGGSEACHFCSKNCATRLNLVKHKDMLIRMIRVAEGLMAVNGAR